MWGINKTIHDEIASCRGDGITVRHRVSVPDFERLLGGEELGKDKPLAAYLLMKADAKANEGVQAILMDLFEGKDMQPLGFDPEKMQDYLAYLQERLTIWCNENGLEQDPRLVGKAEKAVEEAVA